MRRLAPLPLLAVLAFAVPQAALAQSTDNLLLVVNDASPASIKVADAYIGRHSLTRDQVLRIRTGTTDAIDRRQYVGEIETPIADFLAGHSLQDRILYIVLTKGIPLRINGSGGLGGSMASVDSELSVLYRRMVGLAVPVEGRIANPYYLGDQPIADAKHFTRFVADTYLVTRLDAFTTDDVLKLIDRAAAPAHDGTIVLDQKATIVDRGGDSWLQEAADRLAAAKTALPVILDTTKAVASVTGPVLAYYSWGSNDPAQVHQRHTGLQFTAGSIGGTFVSTDGRTFTEPSADWTPSAPQGGPVYAGSFQSLAGDLIRDGLTGVSAQVAEPFLDATIRPQILIPAYLHGFNLAESFYLAMPFLSWQTVIIGDPLCAPFGGAPLPKDQLFQDIDPATELPALFAARRLAVLTKAGTNADAAKLVLKAASRRARDRQADVEPLLLQAVALEPKFTMDLALFYESRGKIPNAIEQYRRVIAREPDNALALNNLAYGLAESQHSPKDALPLAERAAVISPTPDILDTLGWTRHLTGDDHGAALVLERAVAGAPDNAEILLHSAIVHAALDNKARAKTEMDKAISLNPSMNDRAEVKTLRAKVGGEGTK